MQKQQLDFLLIVSDNFQLKFWDWFQIWSIMGVGLRIFIVNDDNSLERLSLKKYERLMKRDPDISFPQYAGKRVRYAEVAIEFENRKLVEIIRM